MKDTFGGWATIKDKDLDHVMNLILTGRNVESANADSWLLGNIEKLTSAANNSKTVLDFGCGIGRNSFALAKKFPSWEIVGYDNDSMLEKTSAYHSIKYGGQLPPNVEFSSDWDTLKQRKFGAIVCVLVLQHIREEPLSKYLEDFKKMTNLILVHGRRFNDDVSRKSTWRLIESAGLTPSQFLSGGVLVPYEPDGDMNDHHIAVYSF